MLVSVRLVAVRQMASGAYCLVALILMLLAKWVHRDISVGNIILVEDEFGQWTGRVSDLEYARVFDSTPSGHKDPKTVSWILRCVAFAVVNFLQGTPFFMPWEVHSRRRLRPKPPPYDENSFPSAAELQLASSSVAENDAEEQWPPFYRYDYDLESLWWILLWTCLFRVDTSSIPAYDLGVRIFNYTSQPSPDRTHVMQIPYNMQIQRSLPPQLKTLVPYIQLLHHWLYIKYASAPINVNGYLDIHRKFWHLLKEMQECVDKIRDIELSNLN